ncbi:hypothetical protein RHGRI_026728 [Rhododendron griersonianum]|uniref:Uncharacterized protein n=1 Tax=Rhododendron griersonianum TaxID=479676 RepID=A0AAV6IW47_9ERIC|nr:hypothetical protein RHGRI_026728 [Rhododendron griersonianum]
MLGKRELIERSRGGESNRRGGRSKSTGASSKEEEATMIPIAAKKGGLQFSPESAESGIFWVHHLKRGLSRKGVTRGGAGWVSRDKKGAASQNHT